MRRTLASVQLDATWASVERTRGHRRHLGEPRDRAVVGRRSSARTRYAHIPGYLGSNEGPLGVDGLLALMDELGVATGIFTGGLDRNTDKLLDIVRRAPRPLPRRRRRRRSVASGPRGARIRELAQHPRVLRWCA